MILLANSVFPVDFTYLFHSSYKTSHPRIQNLNPHALIRIRFRNLETRPISSPSAENKEKKQRDNNKPVSSTGF
jgi:hypothetical protein